MNLNRSFFDRFLSCECLWFLDAVFPNPCIVPDYRNDDFAIYLSQFQQLSYYNDPYYGEVYLLRHLVSGDYVIVRKENHSNEDTFEMSAVRNLQLRSLRNSHIINLLCTASLMQKSTKRSSKDSYTIHTS
jgi:hypothetical protein